MKPVTSKANWISMLKAVPVKNSAAEIHETASGLSVRVFNQKNDSRFFLLRWIVPYRPYRTIQLDTVGAAIWNLCDGKRCVEELCDIFARENRLSFHEARSGLADYLSKLIRSGVLAISLQDSP
ncbi:MAG: PqqD family protein [Lentisphaeria bacterium]|nr:PqqD family protein [Lentisphaeria bacterium]